MEDRNTTGEKERKERFLLSPHLKKTAEEQCNSMGARRSPREE